MPYGIDKELGGDSPENEDWMERCVKRVMNSNKKYDKSTAIAICKSVMKKTKGNKEKAEFILDKDILLIYDSVVK